MTSSHSGLVLSFPSGLKKEGDLCQEGFHIPKLFQGTGSFHKSPWNKFCLPLCQTPKSHVHLEIREYGIFDKVFQKITKFLRVQKVQRQKVETKGRKKGLESKKAGI
jgi:hypothetical protein